MMRPTLPQEKIDSKALNAITSFHNDIVKTVQEAVAANKIVVIGMAQNPFCKKAKQALDAKNLAYKYIEYGSYFSMWKPRLAIKLWSGWPTFPQVFVDGKLVGGFNELQEYLNQAKA